MKKSYTIYMHIVPDGGVYIGATTQKLSERWHGGAGYKRQPRFFSAIEKYGWDAIEHRILETGLTEEEAEQKEREYIKKYDATGEKGYNADLGGRRAGKHSEETKKKIGEAFAGDKHWNYGRKMSQESKAKMNRTTRAYTGIIQFDLAGNYIKTYRYSWQIVEEFGGRATDYTKCCEGFVKTSHGYQWRYVGDEKTRPVIRR